MLLCCPNININVKKIYKFFYVRMDFYVIKYFNIKVCFMCTQKIIYIYGGGIMEFLVESIMSVDLITWLKYLTMWAIVGGLILGLL